MPLEKTGMYQLLKTRAAGAPDIGYKSGPQEKIVSVCRLVRP